MYDYIERTKFIETNRQYIYFCCDDSEEDWLLRTGENSAYWISNGNDPIHTKIVGRSWDVQSFEIKSIYDLRFEGILWFY